MVKAVSKFELYNSQSTNYLEKKKEEFDNELLTPEIKGVREIVLHILEARENGEEARPCLGTCGGECKESCKNLI